MGDVLALIGQYGVMPVIVIVLAIYVDRKEKKHEEERKAWAEQRDKQQAAHDKALADERAACARERAAWEDSRQESYERERVAGEKFLAQVLESQRNMTQVIHQTSQIAAAFELEKREIREERTRELREGAVAGDTGRHRPVLGPKR